MRNMSGIEGSGDPSAENNFAGEPRDADRREPDITGGASCREWIGINPPQALSALS
jgi:hypothetical protein